MKEQDKQDNVRTKRRQHDMRIAMGSMGVGLLIAPFYTALLVTGGSFNPLTSLKNLEQRKQVIRAEDEKHEKLMEAVFSPYGYADRDSSGRLSVTEFFDAYRRAGISGINPDSVYVDADNLFRMNMTRMFPSLNTQQLERIIEGYKHDTRR